MSPLNWKSRSFVAVATASLLTGAGAVALAAAASTPPPASTPTATTASVTSESTDLSQSLNDLLAQLNGLEQTVAAGGTVAAPVVVNGGSRPAGVSDDVGSGAGTYVDDDSYDDSYDDSDSDDDHGDDGVESEHESEDD